MHRSAQGTIFRGMHGFERGANEERERGRERGRKGIGTVFFMFVVTGRPGGVVVGVEATTGKVPGSNLAVKGSCCLGHFGRLD